MVLGFRVDRHLLDRGHASVGWNHVLGIAGGVLEHRHHSFGGGGTTGRPSVTPRSCSASTGSLKSPSSSSRARIRPSRPVPSRAPGRQPGRHPPRGRECASHSRGAARAAVERERDPGRAGQRDHPLAVQTDHPVALITAVEQEQGRDRVGIKTVRQRELGVKLRRAGQGQARNLLGGLRLGGLGNQPGARRVQGGKDLIADRAVVLDDGEQREGHAGDDTPARVPSGRVD